MKKLLYILALLAFVNPAFAADTKISDLSACSTPAGSEVFPLVQSGGNCKLALSSINRLGTVTTGVWNAGAITSSGLILGNANATVGNGATSSGVFKILEDTDAGSNFASFQVPSLAADTVYVLPADDGDSGEQLQTDGSGNLTWEAAGGGGGGTPGGSDTQVQFNDSSAFGGDSGLTFNKTTDALAVGGALSAGGATTITSNSATAFTVGPNGATNPALTVIGNVASQATGLVITPAASGSGLIILPSGGTNEDMAVTSKGNGTMRLGSNGGSITMAYPTTARYTWATTTATLGPTASNTASAVRFSFTSASDSALTAGAEAKAVQFDLSGTRTHASNSAISLQRDFTILPTTHAFATSGGVITDGAGLAIAGAPIGGTNATITNAHGLYIPTWSATNTTNGYGLSVAAPTGAGTTNAAINATGDILTTTGIKSSGTGAFTWSVVTGANTACTTTCTSAAVVGFDTGTLGVSLPHIVGPSDASADECLCAGAN